MAANPTCCVWCHQETTGRWCTPKGWVVCESHYNAMERSIDFEAGYTMDTFLEAAGIVQEDSDDDPQEASEA